MAISNQTVLKKMSSEIQEAMLKHGDDQQVREHVRSVKLLADLFLEQETTTTQQAPTVNEPTVEEVRKMMGANEPAPSKQKKEEPIDHDDANGSSIFDF
ncbi:YwdI family protein [Halobacillus yeomjeoni]|uniref:YwdI family protein n=1 Tax=Halobacillus yeomjeoni TaxID=311194 RepID=A0A931MVF6_9BACI|nr:YwdI family protein [Halobacillus yeomjeoni]MBH0230535.1 YwdI family protein [Halobacillus yeomjeoni]MCA0985420.1 YwdI family protein [Halobacillus yeomjeoni]